MTNDVQTRWVYRSNRKRNPRIRLLLIPHAGAGPNMFREWDSAFPHDLEVCVVHLPGREARFTEAPYRRIDQLVEDLAGQLAPLLDRPFALFGHSMGALVAFELAHRLLRGNMRPAVCLIVSAYAAPQAMRARDVPFYLRTDEALVRELQRLGGTPRSVLESNAFLDVYLPLVRADYEACETWNPGVRRPLECPILAVSGRDDPSVSTSELEAWRHETSRDFSAVQFPGAHFYLQDCRQLLIDLIVERLA